MAITKIQAGALPAGVVTVDAIADTSITHAKLHTTMDLSGKTVTLPTLSSLNVSGTVTADGLTVDTAATNGAVINASDNATTNYPLLIQNAVATGRLELGTYGINNNIDLKLQRQGSTKLTVKSTGIDVTGTVTADGLVVANTAVIAGDFDGGTAATYIRLQDDTDNFIYGTNNSLGSFLVKNETADAVRLRIQNNGDISFYEDTGTTPKFFWDASAERLGLGTSSPTGALHLYDTNTAFRIQDSNGGNMQFGQWDATTNRIEASGTGNRDLYMINYGTGSMRFATNAAEKMRISSAGYVTMPNQPSFQAYNASGQHITGGGTAVFASVRTNIGGCYSTSNGRFTAPVTGNYQVSFTALFDGTSSVHGELRINGATQGTLEFYDDTGNNKSISNTTVLRLNGGDYVTLFINTTAARIHQRYGTFSGFLIG